MAEVFDTIGSVIDVFQNWQQVGTTDDAYNSDSIRANYHGWVPEMIDYAWDLIEMNVRATDWKDAGATCGSMATQMDTHNFQATYGWDGDEMDFNSDLSDASKYMSDWCAALSSMETTC